MIPVRNVLVPSRERGIALVAAILVVLLTSMLVATFMVTTTGERSMSSNVQIAKTSLYAADAGVRTEQQDLANRLNAKIDSCCAAYTGVGNIITSPTALFPSGAYSIACANPPFSATGAVSYLNSNVSPNTQTYDYQFTIQSTGSVGQSGTRRIQSQGYLRVSATRNDFTDYLVYTNTHTLSNGSAIWFSSNTSFDGRVHTNSQFRFAFKPTFKDEVTSVSPTAQYNNNGSPITLNADNNGTLDKPYFYGGFQRNQPSVPLPTNTWNQQSAALTGVTTTASALTNTQINAALGLSGSSTPPNGIYLTHDASGPHGIYVQGDLSTCKMWADTVANRQWYQLTQGGTTRTVLVDGSSVSMWNGTTTTGAPAAAYTGTMSGVMYVNGGIADLRGPDRVSGVPPAAVAENTKLLITAKNDITIQRDITYDSYNNSNNVLGIMSGTGSVLVGSNAPNDCNVDAYVMAIGSSGEFAVNNYDSGGTRGTFHLRGGMVASYYGAFGTFNSTTGTYVSGYGRDFRYDRRGLTPPCYPTTTTFGHSAPVARTVSWKEI